MNTKNADFIWFDGEFKSWDSVTVPITTHALHYGTSVFEGIRGYSNDQNLFIFKLKEHMQRLLQSAEVYSINSNYTLSEMCTSTIELLRKNNIKSEIYHETAKFDKQFKYADRKNIPIIIIIGSKELENNTCVVKNIQTGKQETIKQNELVSFSF